jgi:hypothetical protein
MDAPTRDLLHALVRAEIGEARYEYLRTLNPRQYAELYARSLTGKEGTFDDLVDIERTKQAVRNVRAALDRRNA